MRLFDHKVIELSRSCKKQKTTAFPEWEFLCVVRCFRLVPDCHWLRLDKEAGDGVNNFLRFLSERGQFTSPALFLCGKHPSV